MFLKNIADVNNLREALNLCRGDVILRSSDGREELNLKSQLSQYIAIERLHRECGDEYEFFCMDRQDEAIMLEFFHRKKNHHKIQNEELTFRKEPVQAFKYDGVIMDDDGNYIIPDWAVQAFRNGILWMHSSSLPITGLTKHLYICNHTKAMPVDIGDYIVRLADGEIYAVSEALVSSIFEVHAD